MAQYQVSTIGKTLYQLADRYPNSRPEERLDLRAVITGEKRPPRTGEWYLSGAIIEAYQATGNLDTAYLIARIVRIRVVQRVEIVEELS